MLHALIGQGVDISAVFLLVPLIVLFTSVSYFNRRENDRFLKGDTEVFAITYDVETAYDAVLKQVEEWRRHPFRSRRLLYAALRLGVPRFFTYQDIRPRLYRLVDRYAGVIVFELSPMSDGGTSIKITHSPGSQILINEFKQKLPIKIPSSIGRSCPSCKRIFPLTYTHCPYCALPLP